MIFASLLFVLFIILFLVIPAQAIFKIIKKEKSGDFFVDFGISTASGMVFLVLIALLMRILGFGLWFVWVIPIVSIGCLVTYRKTRCCSESLRNVGTKNSAVSFTAFHFRGVPSGHLAGEPKFKMVFFRRIIILLILIIGVFAQTLVLLRGGWQTEFGFVFPSIHDNMWNIGIVNELLYSFPPQNPAVSGEILKNHHYFYLFFLSIARFATNIPIFDLYYRLGPILVSLLYGISLYAISTIFAKDFATRGLVVFLGFFSGNFAFLLPIFLGWGFDWKGSSFFADQPFDQMFNPYSVLGFSLFLFGIYSFNKVIKEKKKINFDWIFLASLFFGSLYGFKSFGGVIAILSLGSIGVFFPRTLPIFFCSLFIFLPVFFNITRLGAVGMHWVPGWLLTEMMVGRDKLNLPKYAEIENYYKFIHNTLGYLKIKLIELFIYIVGNLGIRLLGFVYLLKNLFSKKGAGFDKRLVLTFILFCILVSISIPLLFNLGGNAYNIIQFTPYSLVLLSAFTSIFLGRIYFFFKKRRKVSIGILIVILLVVLSVPVNIKNMIDKFKMPSDLITYEEISALSYLKAKANIDDIILIDPRQFSYDPIYIPALSERRVYLASPGYVRQTGIDPSGKLETIYKFFDKGIDDGFLVDSKISYIYLRKPYRYEHIEKGIDMGKYGVGFENEKVVILKIKNEKPKMKNTNLNI